MQSHRGAWGITYTSAGVGREFDTRGVELDRVKLGGELLVFLTESLLNIAEAGDIDLSTAGRADSSG
jgi:hypothetical protein